MTGGRSGLGVEVLGTSSFGRLLLAVFADFLAWARVAFGRPTVATYRYLSNPARKLLIKKLSLGMVANWLASFIILS